MFVDILLGAVLVILCMSVIVILFLAIAEQERMAGNSDMAGLSEHFMEPEALLLWCLQEREVISR